MSVQRAINSGLAAAAKGSMFATKQYIGPKYARYKEAMKKYGSGGDYIPGPKDIPMGEDEFFGEVADQSKRLKKQAKKKSMGRKANVKDQIKALIKVESRERKEGKR